MKHLWRTGLLVAVLLGGYLVLPAQAQIDVNTRLRDFLAGTFDGTLTVTGPIKEADGTALLPAYSFASEPTLGFWRSAGGTTTHQGILATTSAIFAGSYMRIAAGSPYVVDTRLQLSAPADGIAVLQNIGSTVGSRIKVDALPVASACGAGAPAVIAGSTPWSGGVTVGTGGPVTCTITFGGTAYPSAPRCHGNVETATGANARNMGYSATATVLTIVPSAAWADGSVVNWDCVSAK